MADPRDDADDRLHAVVIEPALEPGGLREAREVVITRDGETETVRTVRIHLGEHPEPRTVRASLWQLGRHAAHRQLAGVTNLPQPNPPRSKQTRR